MDRQDLPTISNSLYEKLKEDGYSQQVIKTTQWIIQHFNNYCKKRKISAITVSIAAKFIEECFGFDYYNTTIPMQTVIRRPLLILLEFEESGSYCKTHQKGSAINIPLVYSDLYLEYRKFLDTTTTLCLKTKKRKLWIFRNYFKYLNQNGIYSTKNIQFSDVHTYINSLNNYAPETIRLQKYVLRDIYEWMYNKGYVSFSGIQEFPLIRKESTSKILSYYSKEEIVQLLSCIDTSTKSGKRANAAICLLVYLGMRVGDLISLKFSDIDWNNKIIHYNQQKTKNSLSLPLIDEVKYPLIDYIKNARHKSSDPNYIFVTLCAPYTKICSTSSVFRIVEKCMKIANINYEGRHHGSHALRHYVASNLMAENVPLSAISNILGHSSTKTTEIYLTIDETHLQELSLEVPYV